VGGGGGDRQTERQIGEVTPMLTSPLALLERENNDYSI